MQRKKTQSTMASYAERDNLHRNTQLSSTQNKMSAAAKRNNHPRRMRRKTTQSETESYPKRDNLHRNAQQSSRQSATASAAKRDGREHKALHKATRHVDRSYTARCAEWHGTLTGAGQHAEQNNKKGHAARHDPPVCLYPCGLLSLGSSYAVTASGGVAGCAVAESHFVTGYAVAVAA